MFNSRALHLEAVSRGNGTYSESSINSIGGAPVVLSTDIFQITGCHLLVSPCVAVRWIVPSQSSTGGGAAALTSDSVGTCMGASGGEQGTVLVTAAAQTRVAGL